MRPSETFLAAGPWLRVPKIRRTVPGIARWRLVSRKNRKLGVLARYIDGNGVNQELTIERPTIHRASMELGSPEYFSNPQWKQRRTNGSLKDHHV
ncbi:MAG: hypothetical protein WA657_10845, partial [Candidatus Acidiferrales bacterium]